MSSMEALVKKHSNDASACSRHAASLLGEYLPTELAHFVANIYYRPCHQLCNTVDAAGGTLVQAITFRCGDDCKETQQIKFVAPSDRISTGTTKHTYIRRVSRGGENGGTKRQLYFEDCDRIVRLWDDNGDCSIERDHLELRGPAVSEFVKFAFQKVEEEMAKEKESSESPK